MMASTRCLILVALAIVANAAKLKVKVYIRGEPQKWGQKIVVPDKWEDFVVKARDRLELPTEKFPVIRFYDNEDFEMQMLRKWTTTSTSSSTPLARMCHHH